MPTFEEIMTSHASLQYLPFCDVGAIPPGDTCEIESVPSKPGRLDRIILPRSQSAAFEVVRFAVGKRVVFDGARPASDFEPDPERPVVFDERYEAEEPITLTVRNVSDRFACLNPSACGRV